MCCFFGVCGPKSSYMVRTVTAGHPRRSISARVDEGSRERRSDIMRKVLSVAKRQLRRFSRGGRRGVPSERVRMKRSVASVSLADFRSSSSTKIRSSRGRISTTRVPRMWDAATTVESSISVSGLLVTTLGKCTDKGSGTPAGAAARCMPAVVSSRGGIQDTEGSASAATPGCACRSSSDDPTLRAFTNS